MMLISNFVSDLSFFKIMEVTKGDPWWYLARTTASLFVCISGVSYYLANRESSNITRVYLSTKKLILYVNGKEENSTTATVGKVGSTANWTVGFGTQIAYYDGIIEEICLYDIDKTTGDVQFVDTAGSYTYNNP